MPTYEFECRECGPFEALRRIAEAGDPMACPGCGEGARRLYSAPNTRNMSGALYGAMSRAERSAHEPRVVRRPTGGALPGRGRGHGGHCHH